MAKYETMLVTSSALDEEASAALIGKFKSLIEAMVRSILSMIGASAVSPTPLKTKPRAFIP